MASCHVLVSHMPGLEPFAKIFPDGDAGGPIYRLSHWLGREDASRLLEVVRNLDYRHAKDSVDQQPTYVTPRPGG